MADILRMVYSVFKEEFITAVVFLNLESVCKLTFSFLLYDLFELAIANKIYQVIILSILLSVVLYLCQLFKTTALFTSELLFVRIKSSFNMLQYLKLSSLSFWSSKSCDLATNSMIINLLSTDL